MPRTPRSFSGPAKLLGSVAIILACEAASRSLSAMDVAAPTPPQVSANAEKDPCPKGIPHFETREYAGVTLQSQCVFVAGTTVTLTLQARNDGIDRTLAPQLASGTYGAALFDALDDTGRVTRAKRIELGGLTASQVDLIKGEYKQITVTFEGFPTESGEMKARGFQSVTLKFLLWEASDEAKRKGARSRIGADKAEFRFTGIPLVK